jgi:predicted benzoate:H+ symporter BenE
LGIELMTIHGPNLSMNGKAEYKSETVPTPSVSYNFNIDLMLPLSLKSSNRMMLCQNIKGIQILINSNYIDIDKIGYRQFENC